MSNFTRWHFTHKKLLNCLIDSVLKINANFKTNFYGALISVTLYSIRPRPHVCGYFWKRIFFLRFSLPPTNVNAVFGHQKRWFSTMVPRVECFKKLPTYRLRVDRRKRREGFRLITMSYIVQRREACLVRIAIGCICI